MGPISGPPAQPEQIVRPGVRPSLPSVMIDCPSMFSYPQTTGKAVAYADLTL